MCENTGGAAHKRSALILYPRLPRQSLRERGYRRASAADRLSCFSLRGERQRLRYGDSQYLLRHRNVRQKIPTDRASRAEK